MATPHYSMTESENQLVIALKRRPNWLILFLTGFWLQGWIAIAGTFTYGIITDSEKVDGELLFILFIFMFTGIFILKIFLWHLRGKEIITLNNIQLKIARTGTILTIPATFEIGDIENISVGEISTIPLWIRFWGFGGGKIKFEYLGRSRYFGQTLNNYESQIILEKLKERLYAPGHHQNQL